MSRTSPPKAKSAVEVGREGAERQDHAEQSYNQNFFHKVASVTALESVVTAV